MGDEQAASRRQALEKVFTMLDKDGSGKLNTKELENVLRFLGQNPTRTELDELVAAVDDGDGELTFEELEQLIDTRVQIKTEDEIVNELVEAFASFDTDQDYKISREEFMSKMTQCGDDPLTEEEVEELFNALNTEGGDDKLDVNEMLALFSPSS